MYNICNKETLFLQKRNKLNINSMEEIGGYCPNKGGWLLSNIEEINAEKRKQIALKKANNKAEKPASNNGSNETNDGT